MAWFKTIGRCIRFIVLYMQNIRSARHGLETAAPCAVSGIKPRCLRLAVHRGGRCLSMIVSKTLTWLILTIKKVSLPGDWDRSTYRQSRRSPAVRQRRQSLRQYRLVSRARSRYKSWSASVSSGVGTKVRSHGSLTRRPHPPWPYHHRSEQRRIPSRHT